LNPFQYRFGYIRHDLVRMHWDIDKGRSITQRPWTMPPRPIRVPNCAHASRCHVHVNRKSSMVSKSVR
jgi:hypothetical protein